MLTVGMTERRAENLDLAGQLPDCRQHHPREAVRHLADAVLSVTGHALDDATAFNR